MQAVIDEHGRVILPLDALRANGWEPGTEIQVEIHGHNIEIVRSTNRRLEIQNGLPLMVGPSDGRLITAEEVDDLIQQVREERASI